MALLEVIKLSVEVSGKLVLKDVDLSLESNEVLALLGPNAAGKTTLLSTIAGLPRYKVLEGKILFNGIDLTNKPLYERARLGIALAHQIPPVIRYVRAETLVDALAKLYNVPRSEIEELAEKLNVKHMLQRPLFHGFSGGERKRMELFLTMLQRPKLALLDEPDSGVDVDSVEKIAWAIEELRRRGSSIILVSHTSLLLEKLLRRRILSKACVLVDGRIATCSDASVVVSKVFREGYEVFRESGGE